MWNYGTYRRPEKFPEFPRILLCHQLYQEFRIVRIIKTYPVLENSRVLFHTGKFLVFPCTCVKLTYTSNVLVNLPLSNWLCFVLQGASNSCLESCEFLNKVKNFASVTNGDNSSTPTPGTPSITNRSLTSISLKWEAVQNTTGSPVYMIEMEFSDNGGNSFWPVYLSEVDWI